MSKTRLVISNVDADALKQFKSDQFPQLCNLIHGDKGEKSDRKKQTGAAGQALDNLIKLVSNSSADSSNYNKDLEKAIAAVKNKFLELRSIINKNKSGKFSDDKIKPNYKGTWITVIADFLTTLESNKAAPKQEQIVSSIKSISNISAEAKTQKQDGKSAITNPTSPDKSLENSSSSKINPSLPLPHQTLNPPVVSNSVAAPQGSANTPLKSSPTLPAKKAANEAKFNETNREKVSTNNNKISNIENSLSYHSVTNVNSLDEANTIIGENGLPIIPLAQDIRIGFNYEEDEVDSNPEKNLDSALNDVANSVKQQEELVKQREEQIKREAAEQRSKKEKQEFEKRIEQRQIAENLRKQQAEAEEAIRRKQQEEQQAVETQRITAENFRKQQEEQLKAQIEAAENLRKQQAEAEKQRKAAENLQLQNQNNVVGQPNNNLIPPVVLKPSGTASADNNPLNSTDNSKQQSIAIKSVPTPPPAGTVDTNQNPAGTNPTNDNISSQEQLIQPQKGKKRGRSDDDSSSLSKSKKAKYVKVGLGIASGVGILGGGFFGGILAAAALGDTGVKIILATLAMGALTPGVQIAVGAVAGVCLLAGLAYLAYQLYSHYKSTVPTISNKNANKLEFEEIEDTNNDTLINSNSNTKKFNNSPTSITANNKNGTMKIHEQIAASNGTNPLNNIKSSVTYSGNDPVIDIAQHLQKSKQNSTDNSTIKSTVIDNQNENSLNGRDLSSKNNRR